MATMATVRNADADFSVNKERTLELEEYLKSNGCKFVTYRFTGSYGYEPDYKVPKLAREYAEKIGATVEYSAGSASHAGSVRVILTQPAV